MTDALASAIASATVIRDQLTQPMLAALNTEEQQLLINTTLFLCWAFQPNPQEDSSQGVTPPLKNRSGPPSLLT